MSNLISVTDTSFLTGILGDHFDTFTASSSARITVHKEPIRVLRNNPNDILIAGYQSTTEQNYDYIPVSGVFPAIITFNDQDLISVEDINTTIANGEVRIKVRSNARDFIREGKTERIEIYGRNFNLNSSSRVQNYLGLVFYIYSLKATS